MLNFGFAFLCSIILTFFILITNRYHSRFSADDDLEKIQKYHTVPTPRIGGIIIFTSFFLVLIVDSLLNYNVAYYLSLLFSVILVFFIGTLEDLTKRIKPIFRMLFFIASTFVAIYLVKAMPIISYADFNYLEHLINHFPVIGVFLSLFCVVGLTNAYNIIDGYNGLSSCAAIFNLIGFVILVVLVGDVKVISICFVLIGAILGFFLFNYPRGLIFLGDGGAYTIGFIISVLSIYLIHSHRGVVSPYAVLLLAIYPITEIGFSLYRRKFIHRTRGMQPDNMHLHQLIYHRCLPINVKNRNSKVMPLMLFFIIPQVIIAVLCYNSSLFSLLFLCLYIVFYVRIYFKLVRFKTPDFLKIML